MDDTATEDDFRRLLHEVFNDSTTSYPLLHKFSDKYALEIEPDTSPELVERLEKFWKERSDKPLYFTTGFVVMGKGRLETRQYIMVAYDR